MRFRALDLIRYGGFADHTLDFGDGDRHGVPDLHIIVGANEAGKSTTMAAIGDFLFGFPHNKGHDWRFDANVLRVGATLDRNDETLRAIRRRGRQNTLTDAADAPIAAGRLEAWLGGLDREAFLRGWSLDHHRLRKGGEEMLALKDDLGQQLLAAASGTTSLRAIRDTLDEAANAIHKARRGGTRSFARAKEAFAAAQTQLRTEIMTPRAWVEADAQVHTLDAALTVAQERRAALAAERARLERLQRLAGPIAAYRAFETRFDFATPPALSAADVARFGDIRTRLAEAVRLHDDAVRERASLRAQADALPRDPAILDQADTIEDLRGSRSEIRTLRTDLPETEQAATRAQARCRALLDTLFPDSADAPPESLDSRLPDTATRGALRGCAQALQAAWMQYETARNAAETARRRAADSADPARPEAPSPEPDALRTALRRARMAGNADADHATGLARLAEARRMAQDRLEALTPRGTWTMDRLRQIALPPDTTILAEHRSQSTLRERVSDADKTLERAEAALAHQALACAQIRRDTAVVTSAELEASRAERSHLWRAISDLLAARTLPDDTTIAAFRNAMHSADDMADRRFATASDAARLITAEHARELAALHCDQARDARDTARATLQAREAGWATQLSEAGLPLLSPEQMMIWTGARDNALAAVVECDACAAAVAQSATRRAGAIAWLAPFHDVPPGDGTLDAWTMATDDLLAQAETKAAETLRAQEAARTAARHQADTHVAAEAARDALDDAQATWRGLRTTLGFGATGPEHDDPSATEARIVWLDRLDAAQAAVAACTDTIAASGRAARTIAAFEDLLRTVWARVDDAPCPDPDRALDMLSARLERARTAEAQRGTLDGRIRDLTQAIAQAETLRHQARAELDPLVARAQGNTATGSATDHPDAIAARLEAAVAHAEAWRLAQDQRTTLLREIVSGGDGLSAEALLAEADGTAPGTIAPLKQHVVDEGAALHDEIADIAGRLGQARQARDSLLRHAEQDRPGVVAGDRLEDARAEIVAQAEAYLLLRAQGLILRHAVERRRREAQSPLLDRAGALFARATCGRYAGLHVAHDSDTPVLFAATPQETLVPVRALSQGTLDQLFLALRLAAVDQALDREQRLPFLADDLFINFDDDRAEAGLGVLGELATRTQVLFFTHHPHLATRAPRGAVVHHLT